MGSDAVSIARLDIVGVRGRSSLDGMSALLHGGCRWRTEQNVRRAVDDASYFRRNSSPAQDVPD